MDEQPVTNAPHVAENLDIHEPAFVLDPFPAYRRLREECPVKRSEQYGGFWLLTRYEDVKRAAMDWWTRRITGSVHEPLAPHGAGPPRSPVPAGGYVGNRANAPSW